MYRQLSLDNSDTEENLKICWFPGVFFPSFISRFMDLILRKSHWPENVCIICVLWLLKWLRFWRKLQQSSIKLYCPCPTADRVQRHKLSIVSEHQHTPVPFTLLSIFASCLTFPAAMRLTVWKPLVQNIQSSAGNSSAFLSVSYDEKKATEENELEHATNKITRLWKNQIQGSVNYSILLLTIGTGRQIWAAVQ